MKASDILKAGIKHMEDRAATYDRPDGERSMAATVLAFYAVTGHEITEEQGWLFMALLKAVRSQQSGGFHLDSFEDGAAYFALAGEAAAIADAQEREGQEGLDSLTFELESLPGDSPLSSLIRAGFCAEAAGEKLRVSPATCIDDKTRQFIVEHKAEIMAELTGADWSNESRRVEQAETIGEIHAGLADAEAGRVTPLADVKARFAGRYVPSILEPVDLSELLAEEPSAKTAAALDEAREIRDEWDERRMDIIGQNGNDGLHYDELPDGLIWSQAPEWAHSLGSVGIHDDLVWYSDDRYRYALSSEVYAFNVAENTAYSRSIREVKHIASRPSKAAPEQRDDGWTEWAGGKCPAPCEFVDVILRNGKQHNRVHASAMRWEHINDAGDVVLYRVHKDARHE